MRIIVDIDDATGAVTITPETQDPEAVIANPEAVECVADGLTHEFRDAAGRMYRWHDAERQLNIYGDNGLGLRTIKGIDVNAVTTGPDRFGILYRVGLPAEVGRPTCFVGYDDAVAFAEWLESVGGPKRYRGDPFRERAGGVVNIDDIKPDTFAATRSCVVDVVEIFTEHAPDAPPADHRLRREIGGAIEDAVDEGFVAGAQSVPTLDDADMRWLIAQAMVTWDKRWFPLSRYLAAVSRDIKTIAESRWQEPVPGACLHEARRLIRLVETLGIDWPTDADLETAPEGGEA